MLDPDCLAMAAEARAQASREPLENARQKHLTSAATWEGLARLASKMADAKRRVEPPVASGPVAGAVKTRSRVRRPATIS
jgi:hypothetical protein